VLARAERLEAHARAVDVRLAALERKEHTGRAGAAAAPQKDVAA